MRRLILLFLLLLSVPSYADMYPDASNAKLPEARNNLGITEINFRDFGAKGDGTTDDTAAINAAFAAWKAAIAAGSNPTLRCDTGIYIISASVGSVEANPYVSARPVKIEGWGCTLRATTALAGKIMLDLRGNTMLRIEGIDLSAPVVPASAPAVGLAWGRYKAGAGNNADKVTIVGVRASGNYATAACYNMASETNHADTMMCLNSHTSNTSYGLILDAINHFNVPSAFATVNLPVDTASSMANFNCTNCNLQANAGSGAALWMSSNVYGPRFRGGYMLQQTPNPNVLLYQLNNSTYIYGACFDQIHFEAFGATYAFRLSGPAATTIITLKDFCYRENNNFNSAGIFTLDADKTIAYIYGLQLEIGTFWVPSLPLFDIPAKFHVEPRVVSLPVSYPVKFPSAQRVVAPNTTTPITSTAGFVMAGQGADLTFTPKISSNVSLQVCTVMRNNAAGSGVTLSVRTGTGTPPAVNDASTGTLRGDYSVLLSDVANSRKTACWTEIPIANVLIGTPYWVDLAAQVVTSGGVFIESTQVTFKEVP